MFYKLACLNFDFILTERCDPGKVDSQGGHKEYKLELNYNPHRNLLVIKIFLQWNPQSWKELIHFNFSTSLTSGSKTGWQKKGLLDNHSEGEKSLVCMSAFTQWNCTCTYMYTGTHENNYRATDADQCGRYGAAWVHVS